MPFRAFVLDSGRELQVDQALDLGLERVDLVIDGVDLLLDPSLLDLERADVWMLILVGMFADRLLHDGASLLDRPYAGKPGEPQREPGGHDAEGELPDIAVESHGDVSLRFWRFRNSPPAD